MTDCDRRYPPCHLISESFRCIVAVYGAALPTRCFALMFHHCVESSAEPFSLTESVYFLVLYQAAPYVKYAFLAFSLPRVLLCQDGSHFIVLDVFVEAPFCDFPLVLSLTTICS